MRGTARKLRGTHRLHETLNVPSNTVIMIIIMTVVSKAECVQAHCPLCRPRLKRNDNRKKYAGHPITARLCSVFIQTPDICILIVISTNITNDLPRCTDIFNNVQRCMCVCVCSCVALLRPGGNGSTRLVYIYIFQCCRFGVHIN